MVLVAVAVAMNGVAMRAQTMPQMVNWIHTLAVDSAAAAAAANQWIGRERKLKRDR